jgi:hypothetical protein
MELIPGAVNCVSGAATVFGVVIIVILLAVLIARFFGNFEFGEGGD